MKTKKYNDSKVKPFFHIIELIKFNFDLAWWNWGNEKICSCWGGENAKHGNDEHTVEYRIPEKKHPAPRIVCSMYR